MTRIVRMRTRLAATLLVTAVAASVAAPAPAGANAGEKISIRIENDDKVTKKYAGMPVNDASSEFVADPETCEAVPFCTLVPLEVLLAENFNPDINEFVLTVRLGWNDQGLNAAGQGAQGNDLDMYIYKEEKDAKGATVYKEVGRAAGARQPEIAKLFTPSLKDYLIVVYNFLGVNDGFELAVSYRDASIEELGEFEGSGALNRPASGSGSESAGGDSGFGGGSSVEERPSFGGVSSRPSPSSPSLLPSAPDGFSTGGETAFGVPLTPEGGDDFSLPLGTGGRRDLAADLAGNETQDVFRPRVASANPGEVSGVLLGFWFGVVPVALAAGAAFLMRRRRPAALTLQLSS